MLGRKTLRPHSAHAGFQTKKQKKREKSEAQSPFIIEEQPELTPTLDKASLEAGYTGDITKDLTLMKSYLE